MSASSFAITNELSRSLDGSGGTPSSSCGSQDSVQRATPSPQAPLGKKKGVLKSSLGRLFGKKDKVTAYLMQCGQIVQRYQSVVIFFEVAFFSSKFRLRAAVIHFSLD